MLYFEERIFTKKAGNIRDYSQKGENTRDGSMKILAIDLGDVRTGVACSDITETLASPVGVIHEKNETRRLDKIMEIIQQEGAEIVVVGYPKNMDGTIGQRAEISEKFKEQLEAALTERSLTIPVVLWDERSTTVSATNYLNITNTRGEKRKNVVDAVAATIILENYLLWRENNPDKVRKE